MLNLILEKRRTQKTYIKDMLSKYKDDDTIYISFTSDLRGARGTNKNYIVSTGVKLGINPSSTYGTPNGIYAYPLKIYWNNIKDFNIPFASKNPNLWVFRERHPHRIIKNSTYTDNQLKEDFETVKLVFPDVIMRIYNLENHSELESISLEQFKKNIDSEYLKNPAQTLKSILRLLVNNNPKKWGTSFLKIGIEGFVDDLGRGDIHVNEPTQAVFFSKQAIEPIELIKNINSGHNWVSPREKIIKRFKDIIKTYNYNYRDIQINLENQIIPRFPKLFKNKKISKLSITGGFNIKSFENINSNTVTIYGDINEIKNLTTDNLIIKKNKKEYDYRSILRNNNIKNLKIDIIKDYKKYFDAIDVKRDAKHIDNEDYYSDDVIKCKHTIAYVLLNPKEFTFDKKQNLLKHIIEGLSIFSVAGETLIDDILKNKEYEYLHTALYKFILSIFKKTGNIGIYGDRHLKNNIVSIFLSYKKPIYPPLLNFLTTKTSIYDISNIDEPNIKWGPNTKDFLFKVYNKNNKSIYSDSFLQLRDVAVRLKIIKNKYDLSEDFKNLILNGVVNVDDIKTFKNFPKKINGNLKISYSDIVSLKGFPIVTGNITLLHCNNNKGEYNEKIYKKLKKLNAKFNASFSNVDSSYYINDDLSHLLKQNLKTYNRNINYKFDDLFYDYIESGIVHIDVLLQYLLKENVSNLSILKFDFDRLNKSMEPLYNDSFFEYLYNKNRHLLYKLIKSLSYNNNFIDDFENLIIKNLPKKLIKFIISESIKPENDYYDFYNYNVFNDIYKYIIPQYIKYYDNRRFLNFLIEKNEFLILHLSDFQTSILHDDLLLSNFENNKLIFNKILSLKINSILKTKSDYFRSNQTYHLIEDIINCRIDNLLYAWNLVDSKFINKVDKISFYMKTIKLFDFEETSNKDNVEFFKLIYSSVMKNFDKTDTITILMTFSEKELKKLKELAGFNSET